MIKRYTYNRIYITTLSILIVFLFVIFPKKESETNFQTNYIVIENDSLESVYLLDDKNYLTKTLISINSDDLVKTLKDKITLLIIDSDLKSFVPNNFNPIIPPSTKINDLKVKNDTVSIDFSFEFLNMDKDLEEKIIESIIYTLTDEDSINKVIISVDKKPLEYLPISKKKLPRILTREFGINKKYNINGITNITNTTVYFLNEIDNNIFYTPVTYITNDERDKVDIIIEELSNSYQDNLKSYLKANAKLSEYEQVDNIMYLTFNSLFYDEGMDDKIIETVKYTISMSIKENYDVDDVIIK